MKIAALIASEIRYAMGDMAGRYNVKFIGEEKKDGAFSVSPDALCALNGKEYAEIYVEEIGSFEIAPSKAQGELGGKVAVVTGSAQGFGLGIADYLASKGANVVVADMNAAALRSQVSDFK